MYRSPKWGTDVSVVASKKYRNGIEAKTEYSLCYKNIFFNKSIKPILLKNGYGLVSGYDLTDSYLLRHGSYTNFKLIL